MTNITLTKISIGLVLLLSTYTAKSQSISEIISNPELNYFQIQEQITNKRNSGDSLTEREQKHLNRWLTYWDSRIDANGNFSTYGKQIEKLGMNYKNENNTDVSWKKIGPTESLLVGDYKHIGRINSIWVNPKDTSEIFIGTNSAGLWKTVNGGQHWDRITPNWHFIIKC